MSALSSVPGRADTKCASVGCRATTVPARDWRPAHFPILLSHHLFSVNYHLFYTNSHAYLPSLHVYLNQNTLSFGPLCPSVIPQSTWHNLHHSEYIGNHASCTHLKHSWPGWFKPRHHSNNWKPRPSLFSHWLHFPSPSPWAYKSIRSPSHYERSPCALLSPALAKRSHSPFQLVYALPRPPRRLCSSQTLTLRCTIFSNS